MTHRGTPLRCEAQDGKKHLVAWKGQWWVGNSREGCCSHCLLSPTYSSSAWHWSITFLFSGHHRHGFGWLRSPDFPFCLSLFSSTFQNLQRTGNARSWAQPTSTGSECKKIPRLFVHISKSEKYYPVSQYLLTSYIWIVDTFFVVENSMVTWRLLLHT